MRRSNFFSAITVASFCTIILIPVGIALMLYMTRWNKKLKAILACIFSILYAVLVFLILNLEPSYNTNGISLPFGSNSGYTAFQTQSSSKNVVKEDGNSLEEHKSDEKKASNQKELKMPHKIKKEKRGKVSPIYYIIAFIIMFIMILIIKKFRGSSENGVYENPYVDTNQYKLPLSEYAKMPMVHFLRLRLNAGEKIYFATETNNIKEKGDFVVTNQRIVIFTEDDGGEFPLKGLTAISSVSDSVMLLTSGERKYYVFIPENQMKYALAVVRWAFAKDV